MAGIISYRPHAQLEEIISFRLSFNDNLGSFQVEATVRKRHTSSGSRSISSH